MLFCLKDFLLFPIDKVKPIYLSKAYQPHLAFLIILSKLVFCVHHAFNLYLANAASFV